MALACLLCFRFPPSPPPNTWRFRLSSPPSCGFLLVLDPTCLLARSCSRLRRREDTLWVVGAGGRCERDAARPGVGAEADSLLVWWGAGVAGVGVEVDAGCCLEEDGKSNNPSFCICCSLFLEKLETSSCNVVSSWASFWLVLSCASSATPSFFTSCATYSLLTLDPVRGRSRRSKSPCVICDGVKPRSGLPSSSRGTSEGVNTMRWWEVIERDECGDWQE